MSRSPAPPAGWLSVRRALRRMRLSRSHARWPPTLTIVLPDRLTHFIRSIENASPAPRPRGLPMSNAELNRISESLLSDISAPHLAPRRPLPLLSDVYPTLSPHWLRELQPEIEHVPPPPRRWGAAHALPLLALLVALLFLLARIRQTYYRIDLFKYFDRRRRRREWGSTPTLAAINPPPLDIDPPRTDLPPPYSECAPPKPSDEPPPPYSACYVACGPKDVPSVHFYQCDVRDTGQPSLMESSRIGSSRIDGSRNDDMESGFDHDGDIGSVNIGTPNTAGIGCDDDKVNITKMIRDANSTGSRDATVESNEIICNSNPENDDATVETSGSVDESVEENIDDVNKDVHKVADETTSTIMEVDASFEIEGEIDSRDQRVFVV